MRSPSRCSEGSFGQREGKCPVSIDSEDVTVVEVPSLTGIRNALQSLRLKGYQSKIGDMWRVQCVGIKVAKKEGFSNSPEFQIDVIRK
jgi:hypothetical protein